MKKIILPLLILVSVSQLSAQDKIYRKNGQVVNGKVTEVGSSEIKYKIPDDPESPVYILEKDRISKIEYQNGKVEKFASDFKSTEQYIGQLNKAIKIDFLGPLLGYTQISYEKSTGVGKGYEVTFGIIGAGKNNSVDFYTTSYQLQKRNQFGLFGAFGYKFNKLPNFLFGRTRFTHLMQGSYAKPIFYLGNYGENRVFYKGNSDYVTERDNITFAALQIELGKQWVFADKFLLDTYWGFGYGFDTKKGDAAYNSFGDSESFNYVNVRTGTSPGFSLTYGIKLGILIK